MAVYFQLFRKGSAEPSTLQSIDAAICQNLGLPFDDDKYACNWYDTIGLMLALGKSFQQITDWLIEQRDRQDRDGRANHYHNLIRINHFLLENYTSNAWYGR